MRSRSGRVSKVGCRGNEGPEALLKKAEGGRKGSRGQRDPAGLQLHGQGQRSVRAVLTLQRKPFQVFSMTVRCRRAMPYCSPLPLHAALALVPAAPNWHSCLHVVAAFSHIQLEYSLQEAAWDKLTNSVLRRTDDLHKTSSSLSEALLPFTHFREFSFIFG